jgi:flagellar protein FlbD
MIRLFRLDGTEFLLNVDLISQVESTPDTVITLLSGEKIKVKNNVDDVVTKIKAARLGHDDESHETEETPEEDDRPKRKFPAR